MSRSPITTRSKEAISPQDAVFPDAIHVRLGVHVDSNVLGALEGYKQTSNTDGLLYEYAPLGNLHVSNSKRGCKLSGSFRNWADATGVVPLEQPFGCEEVKRTYCALEDRLDLPAGSIGEGNVCRLEYAADLVMPRSPALYIAAIEDPQRATPYRFGYTTFVIKTTKHELKVYDKGVEMGLDDRRTLRIEDLRRDVPQYFGRPIYGADLHDEAFRIELAERWERRARSLSLRRTRVPIPHPKWMSRLRDRYALRGLEVEGGLDVAILQVRAAEADGVIKETHRREQLDWLRKIARDAELTRSSDLAEELDHAIRRVMGS